MPLSMLQRAYVMAVGLSLLTGCARFEFNPAVYQQKKFALVSFFGNKQVNAATGSIGSTQGAASEWGTDFLTGYFPDGLKAIQGTIEGVYLPAEQIIAAPSYARLEGPSFEFNQLALAPLRPIQVSSPDLPGLARLAGELQVDAVVLVQHEWVIMSDPNNGRQYANDKFRVLIVAANGTRLWDQVGNAEGRPDDSMRQALSEVAGSVSPDEIQGMIRRATALAMDKLAERWKENKI